MDDHNFIQEEEYHVSVIIIFHPNFEGHLPCFASPLDAKLARSPTICVADLPCKSKLNHTKVETKEGFEIHVKWLVLLDMQGGGCCCCCCNKEVASIYSKQSYHTFPRKQTCEIVLDNGMADKLITVASKSDVQ